MASGLWQFVYRRRGQRGGLDDRAERVALAAALHAEQADRMRLVEVERDRPAERGVPAEDVYCEDAVLVPRKTAGSPERQHPVRGTATAPRESCSGLA